MAASPPSKPSFSRGRKWAMGFNSVLAALMVLAVTVMINYLSGNYFQRFYLSTRTRVELSPQTLNLLHSVTNRVRVTFYYTKDEPFYADIAELLKEYHSHNARVVVDAIDYDRNPAAAQDLKMKYNLGSSTNVIIFDSGGKVKIVDGNTLTEYTLEAVPNATEREVRRKPITFKGEMMFTAALLAVTSPRPFKACCLEGHGEHSISDGGNDGYTTFASIFRQNYIQVEPLSLLGTNAVPPDCDLLIVAGPAVALPDVELDRIQQYLNQGGRLLALMDARSANRETGLEKVLAQWGVKVGADLVVDPDSLVRGRDIVISAFSRHTVINPILGSGLYMMLPRPVGAITPASPVVDAPRVDEIAFTGPNAYLYGETPRRPGRFPVMVAADQKGAKGVLTERGATRMLVAGDSFFLSNGQIEKLSNRVFASAAANWLLDRTTLLQGVGPRPVSEFRLVITRNQLHALQWILLAAIPGGILLFGGMVWLRRRS
jgi:hypothetical protein